MHLSLLTFISVSEEITAEVKYKEIIERAGADIYQIRDKHP